MQLRQDAGALHPVQLGDVGNQLGDKFILHQLANFRLVAAMAAARHQIAYAHFQRPRQPLQRRERRRGLFVFDLGDVGAWHLHAQRQLPLAQAKAVAQRADGIGHLQVRSVMAVAISMILGESFRLNRRDHWFLRVERGVAAPAKVIVSLKLNQMTAIATDNFPCIYGSQSCGHSGCASMPERATDYKAPAKLS